MAVGVPGAGSAAPAAKPIAGGHGAPNRAAASRAAASRATTSGQAYNWLQPLTPQQVKQEATSMVKSAYAPGFQQLNDQANLENGIVSKQRSDNQYYLQWLDSKSAALQTNQAQVDQATNNLEQQLTANQLSEQAPQAQNLTAAANARAGNVSNNANSFEPGGSALGNELANNQQVTKEELGGASQQALAVERGSNDVLGGAVANTGAVVAAGGAREEAAFNTAMSKIASSASTMSSKEASDLEKEVARLQGVQINLTQNNRNYATAVAKLGISAANTNSLIQQRAASTKIAQSKLSLATQAQAEKFSQDQIKNMQDNQKLALTSMVDNATVALKNAQIYKDTHGGSLTPNEQDNYYSQILKASGEVNSLTGRGMSPQAAYAALLNGGYQLGGKWHAVPRVSNQSLLNAAYNVRQGGPGLSTGDVKYLSQYGLTNISSRLPVQTPASTVTNAGQAAKGFLSGF